MYQLQKDPSGSEHVPCFLQLSPSFHFVHSVYSIDLFTPVTKSKKEPGAIV